MKCGHGKCPLFEISLIPLTKGKFAIVDKEDYDRIACKKWHFSGGYANRTERRKDGKVTIAMHREIAHIPDGLVTDHANCNTLDNRKLNLRACTTSYNHANKKKLLNQTSKYKGVWRSKRDRRWISHIKKNGKTFCLGSYKDEVAAAIAYDRKATELFGKFAHLNFERTI